MDQNLFTAFDEEVNFEKVKLKDPNAYILYTTFTIIILVCFSWTILRLVTKNKKPKTAKVNQLKETKQTEPEVYTGSTK